MKFLLLTSLLSLFALSLEAQNKAGHIALIIPEHQVELSFGTSGILESIPVAEGDRVEAGMRLAALASDYQALEVARFEKTLERREFEYDGAVRLAKDNIISEDKLLESRIELDIARIQAEQAKSILSRMEIRSPLDGIVVTRDADAGEWMETGRPILEVIAIETVYAQVLLPEVEGLALKVGDAATIAFPALEGHLAKGKVSFISPRIDAASGLIRVRVALPNEAQRLRPGMRGEMRF